MKRGKIIFLGLILSFPFHLLSVETPSNSLLTIAHDLNKSDLKTKYEAIEKIKTIPTREAAQVLVKAVLREKDVTVRLAMLDQINALGFASVVPELVPLLSDKNVAIRQRTVRVIGRMGGAPSEDALLAALPKESDATVKAAIVSALEICGSAKSVGALEAAAKDADPSIRANAKHAHKRITGQEVK